MNAYLTASNSNLATVIDRTLDDLTGGTIHGNDVRLTLNLRAQRAAMAALGNRCGAVVALEPKTGRVLVHAQRPTYDPNLVETDFAAVQRAPGAECRPAAPLLVRATDGLYVPGSTFKVVTASAAIDSGRYSLRSTFQDPGYCEEYGKRVFNYSDQGTPSGYGTVNLGQAIQNSINSVFCNIGKDLGAGTLIDYAKRFGFYERPPLETPANERAPSGLYQDGRLFDPQDDNQVDPGRFAFGQERLLVTPLQMAMVAATIANDGALMEPYVVDKIVGPGGATIRTTRPKKIRQVGVAADGQRGDRGDAAGGAGGHLDRGAAPRRRASRARPAPPSRAGKGSTPSPSSASRRPTTRRWRSRSSSSGSAAREARRRLRSRGRSCRPCSGRRRIHRSLPFGAHGHHRHPDRLALRRALPDPEADRERRDGRRLPRRGRGARAARRDQDPQRAPRGRRPVRQALPPRGAERGLAVAPERGRDLRPRRGAGDVLHRHGAPRRAQPEGAHRRARAGAAEGRGRVRAPDPRRARVLAPARDRAPRHQAAQRRRRRRQPREGDRLRDRAERHLADDRGRLDRRARRSTSRPSRRAARPSIRAPTSTRSASSCTSC